MVEKTKEELLKGLQQFSENTNKAKEAILEQGEIIDDSINRFQNIDYEIKKGNFLIRGLKSIFGLKFLFSNPPAKPNNPKPEMKAAKNNQDNPLQKINAQVQSDLKEKDEIKKIDSKLILDEIRKAKKEQIELSQLLQKDDQKLNYLEQKKVDKAIIGINTLNKEIPK